MKQLVKPLCLLLVGLMPIGAFGADTVYKSIDETGHVTYSSQPPRNAVEIEDLQVAPGPSAAAAEKARARALEMGREVDVRYRELMDRRQQEEQLRKEADEAAERERAARETSERLRRLEESLEQPAIVLPYYRRYPYHRRRPYPPYPSVYPPYRPWPPPPVSRPNRPLLDHINTPARNW